mgnify:CR=1 FL=1
MKHTPAQVNEKSLFTPKNIISEFSLSSDSLFAKDSLEISFGGGLEVKTKFSRHPQASLNPHDILSHGSKSANLMSGSASGSTGNTWITLLASFFNSDRDSSFFKSVSIVNSGKDYTGQGKISSVNYSDPDNHATIDRTYVENSYNNGVSQDTKTKESDTQNSQNSSAKNDTTQAKEKENKEKNETDTSKKEAKDVAKEKKEKGGCWNPEDVMFRMASNQQLPSQQDLMVESRNIMISFGVDSMQTLLSSKVSIYANDNPCEGTGSGPVLPPQIAR